MQDDNGFILRQFFLTLLLSVVERAKLRKDGLRQLDREELSTLKLLVNLSPKTVPPGSRVKTAVAVLQVIF